MHFKFYDLTIDVNTAGDVEIMQPRNDGSGDRDLVLLSRNQLGPVIDALTTLKDSKEDWHLVEEPPRA